MKRASAITLFFLFSSFAIAQSGIGFTNGLGIYTSDQDNMLFYKFGLSAYIDKLDLSPCILFLNVASSTESNFSGYHSKSDLYFTCRYKFLIAGVGRATQLEYQTGNERHKSGAMFGLVTPMAWEGPVKISLSAEYYTASKGISLGYILYFLF